MNSSSTYSWRHASTRGIRPFAFLVLVWSLLMTGCARPPAKGLEDVALYQAPPPPAVVAAHTPSFLVEQSSETFNRIGSPSVGGKKHEHPEVFVDPEKPALYYEKQEFSTPNGRYTNLVYRIHFPEVPLDWRRINLTAGRNPGLLIIYTLNDQGELLLVTTVHTCGCYLAFLPTRALPPAAHPADWPGKTQEIYGHTLPGRMDPPQQEAGEQIAFTLASETHRIKDVDILAQGSAEKLPRLELTLLPMRTLYALPYKDGTMSFFETEGCRAGYVKDSFKILERLFMSWWALDLHVGEDKAYSVHDHSGAVFYTSLKFWARHASDMKDFPKFLAYWGWKF